MIGRQRFCEILIFGGTLDRKIQLELAPPISVSEGEENKNNINKSVPEDADVQHQSLTKDCLNIKQLNISEKHKGLKL